MRRTQEEWQAYFASEGASRRLVRTWHAMLTFGHNVAVAGALCATWEDANTCYGDADRDWCPGCQRPIRR